MLSTAVRRPDFDRFMVAADFSGEGQGPAFALKGRNSDPGVTNVRNTASPHWRRWLALEWRCVVPFTSFSENETLPTAASRRSASPWVRIDRWPASPA
jgi:putative SOS response-associated peptidase YedK